MRPSLAFASLLVCLTGCTGASSPGDVDLHMTRDMTPIFQGHCTDGVRNEDESDVDCGGDTCPKCGPGMMCLRGGDCGSAICDNNACTTPACDDGKKNGPETDLDCGGGCPGCDLGKACLMAADCKSQKCVNNACDVSQCMNNKKDGMETDVDCGGGACAPCAGGKTCLMATDCASLHCVNNACTSTVMCAAGTADCNNNAQDGCEVNTNTDAKNCGKCGNQCPMNMANCVAGKCAASMCPPVAFITVTPNPLDVGTACAAGCTAEKPVYFINQGNTPIQLLKVYFTTNDNPPALSVLTVDGYSPPTTLPAGAKMDVMMLLQPKMPGKYAGVVSLETAQGTASACVTGTGQ